MASTGSSQPKIGVDPGSLVGQTINGKYHIVDVIASGGMGRVYRAEQRPVGRPVAIKVLHPKLFEERKEASLETFKKRFMVEASALARLYHTNIVTMHDYGLIDGLEGQGFLVMEYLAGRTLAQRMKSEPKLTLLESLIIIEQIARGLREAHRHGIVHRDLKPSNVMLIDDDEQKTQVKLVDFGLAKLLDDGPKITATGEVLGSPRYMSPEQMTPGLEVDGRTDIYALGVIMFELIAGTHPFESEFPMRMVAGHLHRPPPTLKSGNGEALPRPLIFLTDSCLAKIPGGRPESMDDFLLALRPCIAAVRERAAGGTVVPRNTPVPKAPSDRPPAQLDRLAPDHTPSGAHLSLTDAGDTSRVDIAPMTSGTVVRRSSRVLLGVSLLASILAVIVLWMAVREGQQSAHVAAPSAASLTSKPKSFVLTIESVPAGATVLENDQLLGSTPLMLTLENDEVRTAPRHLTVKLDGYESYTLVQGPSDDAARLVIPLRPRVTP
ncbi:MAG: serine/threonine-protein kinase [Polyangiaceae bacterium]